MSFESRFPIWEQLQLHQQRLLLDSLQGTDQHPVDHHHASQQAGPGEQKLPAPRQPVLSCSRQHCDDPAHQGGDHPDDPPQMRGVDAVDLAGSVVKQPIHGQPGQGKQRQTDHAALPALGGRMKDIDR